MARLLREGDPEKEKRDALMAALSSTMQGDTLGTDSVKVVKDIPEGWEFNEGNNLVPIGWEEFHDIPDFDIDRLRRGVSQVESSGGVNMMNPTSSATGLYGQLFSEIKNLPEVKGVSRQQFADSIPLQEDIFGLRVEGGLPNIPSLKDNAYDLTEEYKPQLGDKWDWTLDEVAAISNFIGRQGAREYFAAIRDGEVYTPTGQNKTVEDYIKVYRGAQLEE